MQTGRIRVAQFCGLPAGRVPPRHSSRGYTPHLAVRHLYRGGRFLPGWWNNMDGFVHVLNNATRDLVAYLHPRPCRPAVGLPPPPVLPARAHDVHQLPSCFPTMRLTYHHPPTHSDAPLTVAGQMNARCNATTHTHALQTVATHYGFSTGS